MGDKVKPLGYVCRPASGACDAAETCDGVSSMCGADGLKSAGEVCRAAVSECDVAEVSNNNNNYKTRFFCKKKQHI